MRVRAVLPIGLLAALFGAEPVAGQCPDGTPPPCDRRPAPPLDERVWLVLPFQNTAHAAAGDLIRDASGHLLYTDLSRWQDVRVVDAQRVDDWLRSLVGTATSPLSLAQGLATARRAGARNLVVGDFIASAGTARVTGHLYDAQNGKRVRSTTARISPFTDLDSLTSAFSRIARELLGVPPPPGVTLGVVGTRSVAALRAYLAGVALLNRFRPDSASVYLQQATVLDSTFGLAFYKLSLTHNWTPASLADRRRVVESAARFAEPLPPRERALIAARLAMSTRDYRRACEGYGGLVRADSGDVEALYGLGDCLYHHQVPVRFPGDSTRVTLRGSRALVMRMLSRAIEVDPAFQPPYEHLMHVLLQDGFVASCQTSGCDQPGSYTVLVSWDHDTLSSDARLPTQRPMSVLDTMAQRFATRRRSLPLAAAVAGRWLAAAPDAHYAHYLYSETLALLGDLQGAERELALAVGIDSGQVKPIALVLRRATLHLRRWRTAEAAAVIDSLLATKDSAARNSARTLANIMGRYRATTITRRDSNYAASFAFAAGVLGADTLQRTVEQIARYYAEASTPGNRAEYYRDLMQGFGVMGAHYGRALVAPIDSTRDDPIRISHAGLQRGDTAGARRALDRFDTIEMALDVAASDNGGWLLSADAHLALGDSALALRMLREWARRFPRFVPTQGAIAGVHGYSGSFMWGRALLLYADLLAARGNASGDDRAAAVRAYQALIGLWAGGDSEVQSFVARARSMVARLGS